MGKMSWRDRALPALGTIIAIGFTIPIIYALQSSNVAQFLSVATKGIMVSAASLLIGGLLGFLFGIPRTMQQDRPAKTSLVDEHLGQKPDNKNRVQLVEYQANTNLEQISDWLTKILVGVGLTQIAVIPSKFQQIAATFALDFDTSSGNHPFTLGIIIAFLICGFLFVFLWTRLYLSGALRQADLSALANIVETNREAVKQVNEQVQELKDQMELDARALALVQSQLNPSPDAPSVLQKELNEALIAASRSIKIQVFNQAQTMRMENWKTNKPKMELTIPIFTALAACDIDQKFHRNYGQLGYALKDKTVPAWSEAEKQLTEAINIRGPWNERGFLLYEFNRAICMIMQDEEYKNNQPSKPEIQERILADLKAAYQGGRSRFVERVPEIKTWLAYNNFKLEDLKGSS